MLLNPAWWSVSALNDCLRKRSAVGLLAVDGDDGGGAVDLVGDVFVVGHWASPVPVGGCQPGELLLI
jgi:hypothetical protein